MFQKHLDKIKKGERIMEAINLNGLTKEDVARVRNFIVSLKRVRGKSTARQFKFNWAGSLKGVFKNKSSVDLQHESANWR